MYDTPWPTLARHKREADADDRMSDEVGFYVVEDRGYDSDAHCTFLCSQNNVP